MAETSMSSSTPSQHLALARSLSAAPDVVFRAWVHAPSVIQWWGPHGWMTPSWGCRIEAVEGGGWRLLSISTSDASERWTGGRYLEIREPERLVFSCGDATDPTTVPEDSVVTIEFAAAGVDETGAGDTGAATQITLRQSGIGTDEELHTAEEFWAASLDRLEDFVTNA